MCAHLYLSSIFWLWPGTGREEDSGIFAWDREKVWEIAASTKKHTFSFSLLSPSRGMERIQKCEEQHTGKQRKGSSSEREKKNKTEASRLWLPPCNQLHDCIVGRSVLLLRSSSPEGRRRKAKHAPKTPRIPPFLTSENPLIIRRRPRLRSTTPSPSLQCIRRHSTERKREREEKKSPSPNAHAGRHENPSRKSEFQSPLLCLFGPFRARVRCKSYVVAVCTCMLVYTAARIPPQQPPTSRSCSSA